MGSDEKTVSMHALAIAMTAAPWFFYRAQTLKLEFHHLTLKLNPGFKPNLVQSLPVVLVFDSVGVKLTCLICLATAFDMVSVAPLGQYASQLKLCPVDSDQVPPGWYT